MGSETKRVLPKGDGNKVFIDISDKEMAFLSEYYFKSQIKSPQRVIRIMINYFLEDATQDERERLLKFVRSFTVRGKSNSQRELLIKFISKNIDMVVDILESDHLLDNISFDDFNLS